MTVRRNLYFIPATDQGGGNKSKFLLGGRPLQNSRKRSWQFIISAEQQNVMPADSQHVLQLFQAMPRLPSTVIGDHRTSKAARDLRRSLMMVESVTIVRRANPVPHGGHHQIGAGFNSAVNSAISRIDQTISLNTICGVATCGSTQPLPDREVLRQDNDLCGPRCRPTLAQARRLLRARSKHRPKYRVLIVQVDNGRGQVKID